MQSWAYVDASIQYCTFSVRCPKLKKAESRLKTGEIRPEMKWLISRCDKHPPSKLLVFVVKIMQEISEDIARQDTPMRKAVTPNRRLTIRLFYLASTSEYTTVANLVGVSTSFLCTCIKNVCEAIVYREEWYQRFPIGDECPLKSLFDTRATF